MSIARHSGAAKCQQESRSSDLGDALNSTWHFTIMSVAFGSRAAGSYVKLCPAMDAPRPRREVPFEGLRQDEILNLPKETIEQLAWIPMLVN